MKEYPIIFDYVLLLGMYMMELAVIIFIYEMISTTYLNITYGIISTIFTIGVFIIINGLIHYEIYMYSKGKE